MKIYQRILPTLFALLLMPGAGFAQNIQQIVFLGDSLSDAGNHFIDTGLSSHQPFSIEPPSASYDIGGHHFSNGKTWAEQLAGALHLPTSGKPSLRAPGVFTNYAVGQARARAGAETFPRFDVLNQAERYLADFGSHVAPDSLVAIWIGGNDVSDALLALKEDPSGATTSAILQEALTATRRAVERLYDAGARMFLIANIPDLAFTPYVRFLDANKSPGSVAAAHFFTAAYNDSLGQVVAGLPFLLPPDPVHPLQFIDLLDTNAIIGQIIASPDAFGVADTSNRCTTPDVIGHAICSTPQRYLFWDGTHPTSTGHDAVADAAIRLLPPQ